MRLRTRTDLFIHRLIQDPERHAHLRRKEEERELKAKGKVKANTIHTGSRFEASVKSSCNVR